MKKGLWVIFALALFIGSFAPASSLAGDTIKVGILGPMTGPNVVIKCWN